MNEKYEQLIAEYLQGTISDDDSAALENLIESGEIDFLDFKATEQLHSELEVLSVPQPSEDMRNRFYEMLAEEQNQVQSGITYQLKNVLNQFISSITAPKLAYAFILMISGAFIGSLFNTSNQQIDALSAEMESMRELMMVSMLEGPSTTDRLRAVNISAQLPMADERAIRALIFTLNNDPSDNVRVQSIQALTRWGDNPSVREGLIHSISRQESDIVIVALADAMVQLGASNAATEFEKLRNEKELTLSTQTKLENTIAILL